MSTWRTEPPTQDGYYWFFGEITYEEPPWPTPDPILVELDGTSCWEINQDNTTATGIKWMKGQWLGPIVVPTPPEDPEDL